MNFATTAKTSQEYALSVSTLTTSIQIATDALIGVNQTSTSRQIQTVETRLARVVRSLRLMEDVYTARILPSFARNAR